MAAEPDRLYVQHMLKATVAIAEYARGVDRLTFLRRPIVQDAIIRQLEIIGEAAKHLSGDFRESHPHRPV
jgi:uncharacterized protein with HEPN domain